MKSDNVMYLLGIDVGTTSVKAAIFNEEGKKVSEASREYSLEMPGQDRVELNPQVYWLSCVLAVKEAAGRIKREEITALSISSQGETLIVLDEEGNPLRKAIVWLDKPA